MDPCAVVAFVAIIMKSSESHTVTLSSVNQTSTMRVTYTTTSVYATTSVTMQKIMNVIKEEKLKQDKMKEDKKKKHRERAKKSYSEKVLQQKDGGEGRNSTNVQKSKEDA